MQTVKQQTEPGWNANWKALVGVVCSQLKQGVGVACDRWARCSMVVPAEHSLCDYSHCVSCEVSTATRLASGPR